MKVKKWKIVVWLTFLFVFTFLLSTVMWAILSWSSISTDELLWHLRTSLDGADTGLIVEFVLVTIGTSTVVTAGAGYAFCKLRKKSEKVERYTLCAIRAVTILNLLLSVVAAWFGFGIGTYIKEYNNATTFIRDEYVDPASVKMVFPGKKRNLIFIYLESMEVTFMDRENGGAFSQNVIPDLTEMAHKYEEFSGADKKPNGGEAPFVRIRISRLCRRKNYSACLFLARIFRRMTAERIRTMPIPETGVSGSEKTRIPTRVATIGSIVARMPARLASTVRRPSV